MDTTDEYTIEFLPAALNDMTEIISSFVMLGSKQGAVRIKRKWRKPQNRYIAFRIRVCLSPISSFQSLDFV